MNRTDLQQLAGIRLEESNALLAAGFAEGAYYLAGYAVECALKACIAKRTQEHDFPDKKLVQESHTHNLNELMRLAELKTGLEAEILTNPLMKARWAAVQEWSEASRYQHKTSSEANELLEAIDGKGRGVLPWIMKRW